MKLLLKVKSVCIINCMVFHILETHIFTVKESARKVSCPCKVVVYKLNLGIYADSHFCSSLVVYSSYVFFLE